MIAHNPFRPTRFEHDEHPLIWLSPRVKQLEGLKSIYIAGTRGSGKTSLLKSINWRERLYNRTLADQAQESQNDYIAVYFRLPDYVAGAIGAVRWDEVFPHAPDPMFVEFDYFSKLIEIISAQLLCEAYSHLRSAGRFSYTVQSEFDFVSRVAAEHSTMLSGMPPKSGLDDLALAFKRLQRELNLSFTRGTIKQTQSAVPTTNPGEFLKRFASDLKLLACGEGYVSCPPNFHIKICIDDCEALLPRQQQFLNSLVRLSSSPLFWIVSYVSSDYDSTRTIIHNQSLTDADRAQINLNDDQEADFYRLCQEVSLLRLYYSIPSLYLHREFPSDSSNLFSLTEAYGTSNANTLLLETMKGTLSPRFAELLGRAYKNTQVLAAVTPSRVPPVWETYIIDRLGLQPDHQGARARNFAAYLRRKQRAALLNICSDYRIANVPYAGAGTIIAMSDMCVRDFLEMSADILDRAIEKEELSSAADLVSRRTPLSLTTQREGIFRASRSKFDGIKNNVESDRVEVSRVIECLGMLCARLQSDHRTTDSLSTPERGIFVFDLDQIVGSSRSAITDRRNLVSRILSRCASDGLLRADLVRKSSIKRASIDSKDGKASKSAYRLHRRFASYFKFSPRGPYEPVSVPMEEFADLCEKAIVMDAQEWVERAYLKVSSQSINQNSLPLI